MQLMNLTQKVALEGPDVHPSKVIACFTWTNDHNGFVAAQDLPVFNVGL
jgi:hypothetical protein